MSVRLRSPPKGRFAALLVSSAPRNSPGAWRQRLDTNSSNSLERAHYPSLGIALERVELPDHLRDESGPTSLVAGPDTGAIVAIEVFVEEDVVPPMRIVLEELVVPIEGSPAVGTPLK